MKVNPQAGCDQVPDQVNFEIGKSGKCKVVLAKGSGSLKTKTYTAQISAADLRDCKTGQKTSLDGSLLRFIDLYANVDSDKTCESTISLPPQANHLQITLASSIGGEIKVDGETNVANGLWLAINDVNVIPCDGGLLPMGKLQVTVMSQYTYVNKQKVEQRVYYPATMDNDIPMVRNETAESCSDFNPVDGTTGIVNICYNTYTSDECLLMATDAGAGTCDFSNLGFLDIAMDYKLSDSTVTPKKSLASPYATSTAFDGPFKDAECPIVQVQEDLTSVYKPSLIITGESLDQLIINQVTLDGESPDSAITLAIQSITITIDQYSRTYDVNQKINLMDFQGSEWSRDVNYCRFIESQTECRPFYDVHSNSFNLADPTTYAVPNKGHSSCQMNNQRNVDIWSFLPSAWVFGQFRGTNTKMTVSIIAKISDCNTNTKRVLRSAPNLNGRRYLAPASADPEKTVKASTTKTFGTTEAPAPSPATNNSGTIIGVVVAIVVIILAVFLFVCLRRRRNSNKQATPQSEKENNHTPNEVA